MSALGAIHARRRRLGYEADDEGWRDLVERTTGQRSLKGLKPKQSLALLDELNRLGGNRAPAAKPGFHLSGQYAPKLQALWIACHNLGVIENRDDAALNAFASKQAKVGHANWIRKAEDVTVVVEALKAMLARVGVVWANKRGAQAYTRENGYKIAAAQWQVVRDVPPFSGTNFQGWVLRRTGKDMADLTKNDWIGVMNDLGVAVRELQPKGAE